jgi:hypothetical protein
MIDLLPLIFLEAGGSLDAAGAEVMAEHHSPGHFEPRYILGVGLEFEPMPRVSLSIGYQYKSEPPYWGYNAGPMDWTRSGYITIRYRPFKGR